MQRRAFLKRGLVGGAVLALGGVGLSQLPGRIGFRPRSALLVFDEKQFNVLAAIAARMVTAPGADPITIAHTIDAALARAAPEAQSDLRGVMDTFDNALLGALLDGRFRPFTRLEPADQDRALIAWRDSRLVLRRGAYKALKNLCTTSFYRKESSWASVGYPGPPFAPAAANTP